MCLLYGHELAQRRRQIFLVEQLAYHRRSAVGQKHCRIAGIAPVGLWGRLHCCGQIAVHRETALRQCNSGCDHVAKAHSAIPCQRREPRIRRARCQGTQEAGRQLSLMVTLQVLHRQCLREHSQAIDGDRLPATGQIHDRWRDTQEVTLVGMHDVQRQPNCHAGIDGVSTLP